ncbi:MAG: hypothetical protein GX986_04580 [Firmicutes bacterium]|nr:hypothetical protein [Bacillota bacterium]
MAPKKKSKAQKKSKTFERVYLILTLIVVAGVAIFLGYVVGQYAIQAATNALDRELAQEGDRVRQQVAETAGRIPPESTAHVVTDPKTANGDGAATPAATSPTGPALKEPLKEPERAPTVERPVASWAQNVPKAASGPAPPAVTSGKQLYRVQVGAFSSEANAQSLAKELREKGYPVLVIPGSLHRVQVGAFAERANAESLKRELEGKGFIAAIISTD